MDAGTAQHLFTCYRQGLLRPKEQEVRADHAGFAHQVNCVLLDLLRPPERLRFHRCNAAIVKGLEQARAGQPAAAELFRKSRELLETDGWSRPAFLIASSFLESAEAYLDAKRGDFERSRQRLEVSFAADRELETRFGIGVFQSHRVQTVHNLARLCWKENRLAEGCALTGAIVAFLEGRIPSLPVDSHWSQRRLRQYPPSRRRAMITQVLEETAFHLARWPTDEGWPALLEAVALGEARDARRHPQADLWLRSETARRRGTKRPISTCCRSSSISVATRSARPGTRGCEFRRFLPPALHARIAPCAQRDPPRRLEMASSAGADIRATDPGCVLIGGAPENRPKAAPLSARGPKSRWWLRRFRRRSRHIFRSLADFGEGPGVFFRSLADSGDGPGVFFEASPIPATVPAYFSKPRRFRRAFSRFFEGSPLPATRSAIFPAGQTAGPWPLSPSRLRDGGVSSAAPESAARVACKSTVVSRKRAVLPRFANSANSIELSAKTGDRSPDSLLPSQKRPENCPKFPEFKMLNITPQMIFAAPVAPRPASVHNLTRSRR